MQIEQRPQLCALQIYTNSQQLYIHEKLSVATFQRRMCPKYNMVSPPQF